MEAVGVIGSGPKAQALVAKMRKSAKVFSYDPKYPLELRFYQDDNCSVFKEPIGYFFPIGEMVKSVEAIFVCLSSQSQHEIVMDQIKECVPMHSFDELHTPSVFVETEFEKVDAYANYKGRPLAAVG